MNPNSNTEGEKISVKDIRAKFEQRIRQGQEEKSKVPVITKKDTEPAYLKNRKATFDKFNSPKVTDASESQDQTTPTKMMESPDTLLFNKERSTSEIISEFEQKARKTKKDQFPLGSAKRETPQRSQQEAVGENIEGEDENDEVHIDFPHEDYHKTVAEGQGPLQYPEGKQTEQEWKPERRVRKKKAAQGEAGQDGQEEESDEDEHIDFPHEDYQKTVAEGLGSLKYPEGKQAEQEWKPEKRERKKKSGQGDEGEGEEDGSSEEEGTAELKAQENGASEQVSEGHLNESDQNSGKLNSVVVSANEKNEANVQPEEASDPTTNVEEQQPPEEGNAAADINIEEQQIETQMPATESIEQNNEEEKIDETAKLDSTSDVHKSDGQTNHKQDGTEPQEKLDVHHHNHHQESPHEESHNQNAEDPKHIDFRHEDYQKTVAEGLGPLKYPEGKKTEQEWNAARHERKKNSAAGDMGEDDNQHEESEGNLTTKALDSEEVAMKQEEVGGPDQEHEKESARQENSEAQEHKAEYSIQQEDAKEHLEQEHSKENAENLESLRHENNSEEALKQQNAESTHVEQGNKNNAHNDNSNPLNQEHEHKTVSQHEAEQEIANQESQQENPGENQKNSVQEQDLQKEENVHHVQVNEIAEQHDHSEKAQHDSGNEKIVQEQSIETWNHQQRHDESIIESQKNEETDQEKHNEDREETENLANSNIKHENENQNEKNIQHEHAEETASNQNQHSQEVAQNVNDGEVSQEHKHEHIEQQEEINEKLGHENHHENAIQKGEDEASSEKDPHSHQADVQSVQHEKVEGSQQIDQSKESLEQPVENADLDQGHQKEVSIQNEEHKESVEHKQETENVVLQENNEALPQENHSNEVSGHKHDNEVSEVHQTEISHHEQNENIAQHQANEDLNLKEHTLQNDKDEVISQENGNTDAQHKDQNESINQASDYSTQIQPEKDGDTSTDHKPEHDSGHEEAKGSHNTESNPEIPVQNEHGADWSHQQENEKDIKHEQIAAQQQPQSNENSSQEVQQQQEEESGALSHEHASQHEEVNVNLANEHNSEPVSQKEHDDDSSHLLSSTQNQEIETSHNEHLQESTTHQDDVALTHEQSQVNQKLGEKIEVELLQSESGVPAIHEETQHVTHEEQKLDHHDHVTTEEKLSHKDAIVENPNSQNNTEVSAHQKDLNESDKQLDTIHSHHQESSSQSIQDNKEASITQQTTEQVTQGKEVPTAEVTHTFHQEKPETKTENEATNPAIQTKPEQSQEFHENYSAQTEHEEGRDKFENTEHNAQKSSEEQPVVEEFESFSNVQVHEEKQSQEHSQRTEMNEIKMSSTRKTESLKKAAAETSHESAHELTHKQEAVHIIGNAGTHQHYSPTQHSNLGNITVTFGSEMGSHTNNSKISFDAGIMQEKNAIGSSPQQFTTHGNPQNLPHDHRSDPSITFQAQISIENPVQHSNNVAVTFDMGHYSNSGQPAENSSSMEKSHKEHSMQSSERKEIVVQKDQSKGNANPVSLSHDSHGTYQPQQDQSTLHHPEPSNTKHQESYSLSMNMQHEGSKIQMEQQISQAETVHLSVNTHTEHSMLNPTVVVETKQSPTTQTYQTEPTQQSPGVNVQQKTYYETTLSPTKTNTGSMSNESQSELLSHSYTTESFVQDYSKIDANMSNPNDITESLLPKHNKNIEDFGEPKVDDGCCGVFFRFFSRSKKR